MTKRYELRDDMMHAVLADVGRRKRPLNARSRRPRRWRKRLPAHAGVAKGRSTLDPVVLAHAGTQFARLVDHLLNGRSQALSILMKNWVPAFARTTC